MNISSFINETEIQKILQENRAPEKAAVKDIIAKSKDLKGLSLQQTAVLLQCEDKEVIEEIFAAARQIKEDIYGNRLVLFAPLYLTNICVNNCLYCGFRVDNKELKRKQLSMEEIRKEVEILEEQGHKRLLLVAGEDTNTSNINYVEEAIRTIYATRKGRGSIRRVNVNVAPLNIEEFRRLKAAGIGTYQLFQETYHRQTYQIMHPSGPKADYDWRLTAMDRAQQAGIDDVGIGVLFGLYDYKFEVLALLAHCLYLEDKFGVGPHTISVPRVRPALNAPLAHNVPYPLSNDQFKKLVAVIRLAVPYTGMILSTREPPPFRDEVFSLGISQISAGSRTNPGAYNEEREHAPESEQFHLEDTRTQLEIIKDMIKRDFFPSFCTSCYRVGRTGKDFMDLAKPGDIKEFCLPNCILTFKEYVLDYGDEELKQQADKIIQRELEKIPSSLTREKTLAQIKRLEQGERDLYF
jgi:2-iminoacetate synthase